MGGYPLPLYGLIKSAHTHTHTHRGDGRVRSASLRSSFFCLIFSFNWSPSRFAATIFSCQSDMIDDYDDDGGGSSSGEGNDN
jgi:hypothetical protein